jgi:hypothetical protein
MHLASTSAGLFLAGGYPYLRASVGYQINLWDFFEEVVSVLIAFVPQALNLVRVVGGKTTAHAGFRYAKLSSKSLGQRTLKARAFITVNGSNKRDMTPVNPHRTTTFAVAARLSSSHSSIRARIAAAPLAIFSGMIAAAVVEPRKRIMAHRDCFNPLTATPLCSR